MQNWKPALILLAIVALAFRNAAGYEDEITLRAATRGGMVHWFELLGDASEPEVAEAFKVLPFLNKLANRLHILLRLTLRFEVQRQMIAGAIWKFAVEVIVQSRCYD